MWFRIGLPAGAAIPRVQVSARNTATSVAFKTVTSDSGEFARPGLPVVRSGITLQVSDVIRIDGKLAVGSLTDAAQVTGQSARLQTASPEVTAALDGDFSRLLGPAIGADAAARPVTSARDPRSA